MLLRTDILQKTVNSQQLRIFYAPFSSTGWINSRDNVQDASYILHILTSNDSKLHLLSTLQYEFFWAWPDKPQNKFKWRYDRRSGNCNLSNCKSPHPPSPQNSGLQRLQRDSNLRPPAIGSNPVEAQKFFRGYLQLLKCSYHCDDHVFIKIDVFPQFKSYSNSVKTKTNKKNQATVWIRASLNVFIVKSRKGKRRNVALWKMHAEIPDKNYREKLSVIVQLFLKESFSRSLQVWWQR